MAKKPPKYLSIKDMIATGNYPMSLSKLTMLMKDRSNNGLWVATKTLGRKLYINVEAFEQWIEENSVD